MSGMPLETCWTFNERWNIKFCYKVASCWLFLLSHTTMHGTINIKKWILNWSCLLFGKKHNFIFSHSPSFFEASAPFWAMTSPLPGFRDSLILRWKDVSPTFNPQPWTLGYLVLSGTSLKFCPAWVALLAAKLPPVWLCVQAGSFYHDLQALDKVDMPSRNLTPSFDSLVVSDNRVVA